MPTDAKTFAYKWACWYCGRPAFYGNKPAVAGQVVGSQDWYDRRGAHPETGSVPNCEHCGKMIRGISSLVAPTPLDEAQALRERYDANQP